MKPVVAIGFAFAAQEVARVPTTALDARLDLVLTEREVIDLPSALELIFADSVYRRHLWGCSGRAIVQSSALPGLIRDWKLDLVVVNGENAAGGFGITESDLSANSSMPASMR